MSPHSGEQNAPSVPLRRAGRQTWNEALPPGVKGIQKLDGHVGPINSVVWSPNGRFLAVGSNDKMVTMWDALTFALVELIDEHKAPVTSVAFDPHSKVMATADNAGDAYIWQVEGWKKVHQLRGARTRINAIKFNPRPAGSTTYQPAIAIGGSREAELCTMGGLVYSRLSALQIHEHINDIAFDSAGQIVCTAANSGLLETWDVGSGRPLESFEGHLGEVTAVAFSPDGNLLVSAAEDQTIKVWSARSGELLRSLEGHSSVVHGLSFISNGQLLASEARDGKVILWDCHKWVAAVDFAGPGDADWASSIAFHPRLPLLASTGIDPDTEDGTAVFIWSINPDHVLTGFNRPSNVTYTSAKIVLVGESGVGKTGLGYRLATGDFKNHPSTHGQQFWTLDELRATRTDGAECEAILWDLAGQPDYRLVHALFVDDADIALVLFDPTRGDDPLRGVDYWLRQLGGKIRIILVAARSDLGVARLTTEDIREFCRDRGIHSYIVTSALTGEGLPELVATMRDVVEWDARPTTVTTTTFKWIKDTVLDLKETRTAGSRMVVTPAELRQLLETADDRRKFSDAEMLAAVRHLINHGYVAQIRTSRGEHRILLKPELLNNVASSIVLQARRNYRGLGFVEESKVLLGGYDFPELDGLERDEREALLDAAVGMFLSHNVCLRETDTLNSEVLLVFPDLINLRRPPVTDPSPVTEGTSYTVSGAVENVYASLVVLLGYTNAFTRTRQWRDQAEYVIQGGQVCGFRLESEREGELDFVLHYKSTVGRSTRTLFQGLFESFLSRRDVTVHRYPSISCTNGHRLNRAVVREHLAIEHYDVFCTTCGASVSLARASEPIQMTRDQMAALDGQRYAAIRRSRFEQALFTLKAKLGLSAEEQPTCFMSYAWGDASQENWTMNLARDLSKAGVTVVLDRWENNRVGASVPRFVERIAVADRVVVVGTPQYRTKYENNERMGGFVVAAEGDLIGARMIGTEAQKESVMPVLFRGSPETSFPALLMGRVFSDFRVPDHYFQSAFDLILSIHGISVADPQISTIRDALKD